MSCCNATHILPDLRRFVCGGGGGSTPPTPAPARCRHALACIGRHVIAVGGVTLAASGHEVRRQDTWVFDSSDGHWEELDASAFEPPSSAADTERLQATHDCDVPVVSVAATSTGGYVPDRTSRRGTSVSGAHGSMLAGGRYDTTAPQPFLGVGTCTFVEGGKLLLLKAASPEQEIPSELWTVDLQLPEAMEQRRQAELSLSQEVKELVLQAQEVARNVVR